MGLLVELVVLGQFAGVVDLGEVLEMGTFRQRGEVRKFDRYLWELGPWLR